MTHLKEPCVEAKENYEWILQGFLYNGGFIQVCIGQLYINKLEVNRRIILG